MFCDMYFFSVKDFLMTRLGMDTYSIFAFVVFKYAYLLFLLIVIDKIFFLRIFSLIGLSCSCFVIVLYFYVFMVNLLVVKKCVLEWRKNVIVLILSFKGVGEL